MEGVKALLCHSYWYFAEIPSTLMALGSGYNPGGIILIGFFIFAVVMPVVLWYSKLRNKRGTKLGPINVDKNESLDMCVLFTASQIAFYNYEKGAQYVHVYF